MILNPDKESEEKMMRRHISISWAIALLALCTPMFPKLASAQQETKVQKPITAYRLEFSVRELENGKRLNSRNYMMMAEDGSFARVRVGNRVPYQTAEKQYQYSNVGMNIDCRPHEQEEGVALDITVDFSSVAPPSETAPSYNPVFRSNRSEVQAVVLFGKPTLVTSLDDVETNRHYEIEVTATKVK
ncbi:conserved exported hypothetical protein [Acidobacteriia bacterium SbA2]|nr:conserved exported hypothetical protein [Acidobacteriia bacterium SbA2]